jgi:hypothetical protein
VAQFQVEEKPADQLRTADQPPVRGASLNILPMQRTVVRCIGWLGA